MKTTYLRMCYSVLVLNIFINSNFLYTQNVINVSSMEDLQSAINIASSGDVFILVDGTYANATLDINQSNITVKAATPGGVYLNGAQYVDITGSYITFSGFQFTSGDIGSDYIIKVLGSHNVLTQLNFNGYSAKKYISISEGTQYNEISYCNIENKPVSAVIGCTIQISTSPAVPGHHKIRYCSFKNFPGPGGDYGNEPIRIGLGAERNNNSRTVVEYCYFDNAGPGDSESISVKCCENVIRYCTFTNNPEGMLVFRNGDRNVAYGNFFIKGSGGIRVKEARDIYCYNNYFETSGVSGDMDAITFAYDNSNGYALDNINFIHNTFVNCGDIDLGDIGPTNVTFANNIFKKNSGNIFNSPNGQTSFAGNIYTGTLGITILSGMTNLNPMLELNSDGYYGLSSSSPAIDASSSNYPAMIDILNVDDDPSILLDISGQARPSTLTLKDVGCDEYTTGEIINRPLTLSDVGPSYLINTYVESENEAPNLFQLSQNYPNPFNPETRIQYSLANRQKVSVKVFDLLGNEVTTLVDEEKSPGNYEVIFNAQESINNKQFSSGIYFYQLKVGNLVKCMKMVLLK